MAVQPRSVTATLALAVTAVLAVALPPLAAAPPTEDEPASAPMVLVGVAGLAWADVDPAVTPTLFAATGGESVANLSVRTVRTRTCPIDGWLTIGAGRRAGSPAERYCAPAPEPRLAVSAEPGVDPTRPGTARIPGWPALRDDSVQDIYGAELGLLHDRLEQADACATAIGPGAALALASPTGAVERYLPPGALLDPAAPQALAAVVTQCQVTVIDLGSVPGADYPGDRAEGLTAIDTALAALRAVLPPTATVLVAGIADSGPTSVPAEDAPSTLPTPALRLAMATGDGWEADWLTSGSTRWTGMVQLTDLTPTLLAAAGADTSGGLAGAPWEAGQAHPNDAATTVEELTDLDQAEQIFRKRYSPFYRLLGYVQATVYGLTLLLIGWREPRGRRGPALWPAQTLAYLAAAIPVSSFLTNLTAWWRADRPELMLWLGLLGVASAVAVLAARGPWRRWVAGPPTMIAALTAVVLAVDVLTGSRLQNLSLLGLSPTVAGRFYGFGNIPFAIFASSVMFLAAAAADQARRRGATATASAGVALLIGLVGVMVVGAPSGGADFGGLLSMLPGVLVLAAGLAQVAITWRRVLIVGVGTLVVVALVSVLDYLRPQAQRSHFGDFVATVVDGSAWTTVSRKADAALGTLDSGYAWLVPLAYLVVWRLMLTRSRPRPPAVVELEHRWPAFRQLVIALMVTGAIGFAVNDSGMIVPAMMASTSIPLAVIALVDVRRSSDRQPSPAAPGTGTPDAR